MSIASLFSHKVSSNSLSLPTALNQPKPQDKFSATDLSIPSVTSNTSAGSGGNWAIILPSSVAQDED